MRQLENQNNQLVQAANIENSGDSEFSNFGSPHWPFVSLESKTIRNPPHTILSFVRGNY